MFEDPSHPFRSSRLARPGHGFTPCDGFSHFIPGGTPVDRMPIETWVGEAAVVDLTHVGANTAIEAADLEARGQHVRRGDIALLRTDWPRRQSWETLAFWTEAPWTGLSACRWLVARGVNATVRQNRGTDIDAACGQLAAGQPIDLTGLTAPGTRRT